MAFYGPIWIRTSERKPKFEESVIYNGKPLVWYMYKENPVLDVIDNSYKYMWWMPVKMPFGVNISSKK